MTKYFNAFSNIDLSQLPPAQILEELNFETLLEIKKSYILSKVQPEYRDEVAATLNLESEPLTILSQVAAYVDLNFRQRVNDAVRAVLLAYAVGSDLDHLGANKDVKRLIVQEADNSTIPPTPEVVESDDEYRRRIQLAPEGYSCAGPYSAYLFYALGADGKVKDISITRPRPGDVAVYVLSHDGNGTPTEITLNNVSSQLNAEDIRPLNDTVLVNAPTIVEYTITATLIFYPGVHKELSIQAAQSAIERYTKSSHRLGVDITLSGIIRALKQEGVQDVVINEPSENIVVSPENAAYCTGITLSDGGTNE